MAKMEPLTLTVEDAKAALSLGHTTVYKLIKAKKLDVVKVGRRTLITVASIKALVGDVAA